MQRVHGWIHRMVWVLALALPAPAIPAAAQSVTAAAATASSLPGRLSDTEFWSLVSSISEPGGYFRITDNFTSNEPEIGVLFSLLRERGVQGGVYLGVGPEQNFTYMASIRPAMAFIVDIRRQAVMQHLMFKAIFELALDRAEFISILFAKPRPEGLDSTTHIQRIWEAYAPTITDRSEANLHRARLVDHLTRTHGFQFTPDETESLKYVYDSFVAWGPSISTRGSPSGGRGGGNGSTFADLTGWATDATGEPRSFLSTEEHYNTVRQLHEANLIVPVSGDFGGPKAIRAIGDWLRTRGGVVRAFYVSNVEQYLFQDGKARAFYDNVATLPVDDESVFIRPNSLRRMGFNNALCSIAPFLMSVQAGGINSNTDALMCGT
ncbi:MAG TPA: hypothetical protein VF981_16885 [Gemmatimonadaceae bacterium]